MNLQALTILFRPCPYPHPPFDEACWAPAPSGTQPRAVLWDGAPRYEHGQPAVCLQPPSSSPMAAQQEAQQQQGWSPFDSVSIGPAAAAAAMQQPALPPELRPVGGTTAAAGTAGAAVLVGSASGGEEEVLDELLQVSFGHDIFKVVLAGG